VPEAFRNRSVPGSMVLLYLSDVHLFLGCDLAARRSAISCIGDTVRGRRVQVQSRVARRCVLLDPVRQDACRCALITIDSEVRTCATSYDPVVVRRRHQAAPEAAEDGDQTQRRVLTAVSYGQSPSRRRAG
jgi:hypothetical protein